MFVTKEQKFLNTLKDIFVGAKVEGESGFINLMRIKSCYFEKGVFPRLMEDINKALEPFPDFREELFDRFYTFFHRYFSETGSIYYCYTPLHERVYEQVYTDDQDVMLFWKTHMLYYVKTDRLFRNIEVEVDGFRFFFDVSTLEHKKANEKRALVYEFKERRENGNIVFSVIYSERGRKTKLDEIRREIRDALGLSRYTDAVPSEETLEHAFSLFERQSEVDYFICKNAQKFLKEQFDLWLYQYIFEPEIRKSEQQKSEQQKNTIWNEKRIRQLQVLKDIAYKIIDFIAQFENELVKIWNKPKFVLDSHYVVTLDRIAGQEKGLDVIYHLLKHPGMATQLQEWRNLGMVDNEFELDDIWKTDSSDYCLNSNYQYLPIDTKYFPDLELTILGLFDHLDKILDGWLVYSENYQALNTLLPKFHKKIDCIYIDPPYNSESSEIDYVNTYKHSSWMTLLENRLVIAKDCLKNSGILCVAIDDNELLYLKHVLSLYFPEELGIVVVRSNPAGRSTPKGFSIKHEYALFFAKTDEATVGRLERNEEQKARYKEIDNKGAFEWVNFRKHGGLRKESPKMFYPIYVTSEGNWRVPKIEWSEELKEWIVLEPPAADEQVLWPIDENNQERRWKWTFKRLIQNPSEVKVDKDRNGNLTIYIKSRMPEEGITPPTWWDKEEYSATDHGTRTLKNLFGQHGLFTYPKAVTLVSDCIRACSCHESAIILDFFAGSGTTAHAVIDLNRQDNGHRKYILVEMADYFNTVLLPRIKKVIFSDQWEDGKARKNGKGTGHFIKYFQLEQYEDVLRRAHYADAEPLFVQADPYSQYVFLRDTKLMDNNQTGEQVVTIDTQKNEIRVNLSKLYENIDLAETISCVTGKWIRRILPSADDSTKPGEVEFEDGTRVDLVNPPWKLVKPLIWW